jgi:hypothetical protein
MYGTATPSLTVSEVGDRVRLDLAGIARGEGCSLQDAADDLVCAVLRFAHAVRSTGFSVTREMPWSVELYQYLHELGEFAAAGGDVRQRLFG